MLRTTRRILLASVSLLSVGLGVAEAQQNAFIVRGEQGSSGAFVSGGSGSAVVSDRHGTQGIVVDSQGRVRRFHQRATAGRSIGAFAGGGTSGIATGDFDPFDFAFGQRGFPASRFETSADTDAIEAAYRQGDYQLALQRAEKADQLVPGDPEIQQLHALALFALGRYPEAGLTVRDVLTDGVIWTWPALRRLHPDDEAYLNLYRRLQTAATSPVSADTLILLAYHDLVLGRLDAARKSLQKVVELQPDNSFARTVIANLPPDPTLSSDANR